MEIIKLVCGLLQTNSYIIKKNKVILIDPTGRIEKMESYFSDCELVAVLLTHGHFDHIKTVDKLYAKYHMPICLNKGDHELVKDEKEYQNNIKIFGTSAMIKSPIIDIEEGEQKISNFDFTVFHTPGHTMGSVIYLFDDNLFTGDTLFKDSVGRTDLKGGNEKMLKDSLRFIKTLNPSLKVLPGHGESSTLEIELNNNIYL